MITEVDFEKSDSDDPDYVVDMNDDSNDFIQSDNKISNDSNISSETSNNRRKKKRCRIIAENELEEKIDNFVNNSKSGNSVYQNTKDEKEETDRLWISFLSDTASSSNKETTKNEKYSSGNSPVSSSTQNRNRKQNNSNVSKSNNIKQFLPATSKNISKNKGISTFLNNKNKKSKLSTLEKSKLDWNQFKEEHCLEEEITNFNRGKSGYLERQDFLKRTDSRQFEIEKEMRITKKKLL